MNKASHALRFLSIGPVLQWLGTHPVEDLLRPVEEWVCEALQLGIERSVSGSFTSSFIEACNDHWGIPGANRIYQLSQLFEMHTWELTSNETTFKYVQER